MSITDELRGYVQGWRETPNLMDELDAGDIDGLLGDVENIADRIDAEHEAMLVDARKTVYQGYIELPKDADGVPIHAGDTLDGYGKTIEVVEMRYGRGGWVLISRDGSGYADTFAFAHHHEPTVEDVLMDLLEESSDPTCDATPTELAEKYAAKLRLAESEDA